MGVSTVMAWKAAARLPWLGLWEGEEQEHVCATASLSCCSSSVLSSSSWYNQLSLSFCLSPILLE